MPQFSAGAGPRAGIALLVTARARAVLQKRGYVIPEDIKALAPAVLRHRVQRSAEAEIDDISTDSLLAQLLQTVPVPRQETKVPPPVGEGRVGQPLPKTSAETLPPPLP